jgi:hypothetical protein
MNAGSTVFAELLSHLPRHTFRKAVERYRGQYRVRTFSCWDQLVAMAFAQLTGRDSLRNIESCLSSRREKLYHAGLRGKISRSTLADANERRDFRIYQDVGYALIRTTRKLYQGEELEVELGRSLYAFDSTTVDLCLSIFPLATFRKTKAAIKMHTLLDLKGSIPTFVSITPATVHDVLILDAVPLPTESVITMDRRYPDFARLYAIHLLPAFFVIRGKRNLRSGVCPRPRACAPLRPRARRAVHPLPADVTRRRQAPVPPGFPTAGVLQRREARAGGPPGLSLRLRRLGGGLRSWLAVR